MKLDGYFLIFSIFCVLPVSVTADEIRIGVLADLSSASAGVGRECLRGVELSRQLFLNKTSILHNKTKVFYGDHKGDPKTGIQEYRKLRDLNKIDVLLSTRTSVCLSISQLALHDRVVFVGITGHQAFVDNNAMSFDFWPTAFEEGKSIAEALKGQEVKRVAVLTSEDDWTISVKNSFLDFFPFKPVYQETVSRGDFDLGTAISRILKRKPDGIFLNLLPDELRVVIKKLSEFHVNLPIFGNLFMRSISDYQRRSNVVEAYYVEPDWSDCEFEKRFRTLYPKDEITGVTYACSAAVAFIAEGIKSRRESIGVLNYTLAGIAGFRFFGRDITVESRRVDYPMALYKLSRERPIRLKSL